MNTPPITIVILAGGRSSRMKQDKALLQLEGMSLLERIARTACQVSPDILILGRSDSPSGWPAKIPARFQSDASAEPQGPMPALITALIQASSPLLLLACDTPLLTADTLRLLLAAHAQQPEAHATIATRINQGRPFLEPTLAIYTPAILTLLQRNMRLHHGSFQPLKYEAAIHQWFLPENRCDELLNINDQNAYEILRASSPP